MRFHLLGIPHTITTPDYTLCAFTQKVVKLARMLVGAGHHVIHYGHEQSEVAGEHVTVTTAYDLAHTYPDHDWRRDGLPKFTLEDHAYQVFNRNTIAEVEARKQPGDFLLCMWGSGHRAVADAHADMLVCEPGIGYPWGHFAPFKVFESYALLHAYLGLPGVATGHNDHWYDVVIPNYFDPDDFTFSMRKEDYLLFLGRVGTGKGVHIAIQVAEAAGMRLVVAGPGEIDPSMARTSRPLAEYVTQVGVVDGGQRRELLAKARAVLCPSTFCEPFNGVHVEAMLSGTPVISTDWGAFTEYNLHGITGWRCRTLEQFVWAAKYGVQQIDRMRCWRWAETNFSEARITPMYEEFFGMVHDVWRGQGFYEPHPERTQLDWLTRRYV